MYQKRISTSETPRVEVTACQGDLLVATWDSAEVLIEVESEEVLTVEEREGAVALVANRDCSLTVPAGASLVVIQAQGNLSVQGALGTVEVTTVQGDVQLRDGTASASLSTVQGDLTVERWTAAVSAGAVHGDARVQQVGGPVEFGLVGGDLLVENASGSLLAQSVAGDARVQQVGGPVEFDTVGGDLLAEKVNGPLSARSVAGDAYLRQLNGMLYLSDVGADLSGWAWTAGADVAQVGGDVSLKTVFVGPFTYEIQAKGNVIAKVQPGSSATFTLRATKGQIKAKGITGEIAEDGQWKGAIGDGEVQVTLTCTHGNMLLKTAGARDENQEHDAFAILAADLGRIGAEAGVAAQELAWRIQQRMADKLATLDLEAIALREAEKARRQAEREIVRAQRTVEKARRKAERAQEKAHRKVQRHFERDASRGRRRTTGRSQVSSEEERLAVLEMLAKGTISTQEAEILLNALEG